MASHDEVEHMKREIKRLLADQAREIAKLKVIVRSQAQAQRPMPQNALTWVPQTGSYATAPAAPMNPMLLLAVLMGEQGANANLTSNPLMMFALMQMLQQSPVASVGGQPVNIDLTTLMMFSQLMGLFRPTGKIVKN